MSSIPAYIHNHAHENIGYSPFKEAPVEALPTKAA
jgi:hypothetical protein